MPYIRFAPGFLLVFASYHFLWASPGQSSNESWSRILFPMAKINKHGDYVMAYSNKIVVRWEGTFYGHPVNTRAYFPKLFTGGISGDRSRPEALICAGRTIWNFRVESGRGIYSVNKLESGMNLRCALLPHGQHGIFDTTSKRMVLADGRLSSPLPLTGDQIRFVAVGSHFMAMDDTGFGVFVDSAGQILSAKKMIGGFDSHWSVEGGDLGFLAADSFGTYEMKVDSDFNITKRQLAPTPCEEKQICGLSYASDGSWFVVGYWGAYHGRGNHHVRVPVHNLPGEFAGVGASHNREGGDFIFFGADNGDIGTLPPIESLKTQTLSSEDKGRSFVWTDKKPEDSNYVYLGEVELQSGRKQHLSFQQEDILPHRRNLGFKVITSEPATTFTLPSPADSFPSPQNRWWSEDMRLEDARLLASEKNLVPGKVRVAVIDTGYDFNHNFQANLFWINPGEIPGNYLDDDGNGLIDDQFGYDFVNEDHFPEDENGHGTHVSGLITAFNAQTGDQFGVAPNAQLLVAKVFNRKGQSNSIDLARAVIYAAHSKAEVVNCSWGGGAKSQGLNDAFAILAKTGALIITSAGNQSLNLDVYPQVPVVYPGVVAIGATTRRGRLAAYSNYGSQSVKFLFPGSNIWSSVPGGLFAEMSGTSMSAGVASGSMAWLLGVGKSLSAGAISNTQVLEAFCEGSKPGPSNRSQCGRVDLLGALESLLTKN